MTSSVKSASISRPTFALKFDEDQLGHWASRYPVADDYAVEHVIGPRVRENSFLAKDDFCAITHWKSPRSQKQCEANSEEYIHAVTRAALTTLSEEFRVRSLTCLRGVDWPTASAILHLTHTDPYPIMDWRAMWSLSVYDEYMASSFSPSTFEVWWWPYTIYSRNLAEKNGLSMRTVDRALWQYCKENGS